MSTKPEKKTRTHVDTICFTRKETEAWLSPPFQRELKTTPRVQEISAEIAENGGVVPGVLTLGKCNGEIYLLDGQHRRAAFMMTDCKEGYADVRIHEFDSMAEMGEEFVRLNTQIVRMKPDDILRGMEGMYAPLKYVRKHCPFIGYDNIRRNEKSPVVSMSQFLRAFMGGRPEVPVASPGSAMRLAQTLTTEEAALAVKIATLMFEAWGRGDDVKRLWSGLNLTLLCWLYRRTVLAHQYLSGQKRSVKLTEAEFSKCLMSLAANAKYNDWLAGRTITDRNRSPAYHRIKEIFGKRIQSERGMTAKPLLPQPPWAPSHGGRDVT